MAQLAQSLDNPFPPEAQWRLNQRAEWRTTSFLVVHFKSGISGPRYLNSRMLQQRLAVQSQVYKKVTMQQRQAATLRQSNKTHMTNV